MSSTPLLALVARFRALCRPCSNVPDAELYAPAPVIPAAARMAVGTPSR